MSKQISAVDTVIGLYKTDDVRGQFVSEWYQHKVRHPQADDVRAGGPPGYYDKPESGKTSVSTTLPLEFILHGMTRSFEG